MHCAKLFEIVSQDDTNVFRNMSTEMFKMSRKVCVEAILHTDMAEHFKMVKDLDKFYEIEAEACELQARDCQVLKEQYLNQVLSKETQVWLRIFLHLADVSNPLKPFKVCQ